MATRFFLGVIKNVLKLIVVTAVELSEYINH